MVKGFSRFDDPLTFTSSIGFRSVGMYSQRIARSSSREMRFRALTLDAAPKGRSSIHVLTARGLMSVSRYSLHLGLT